MITTTAASRGSEFRGMWAAMMVLSLSVGAMAQANTDAHNVAVGGCRGCHAPTNSSTANEVTLDWARSLPDSSKTFGAYDSATMKNKAVELGGSPITSAKDARMHSLLCLSCHDGVTTSFSATGQSAGKAGSRAAFVSGATPSRLATNHPVNMSHDPVRNRSLRPVSTVMASLPLYGPDNTVQCATCHDPHTNTNTKYLRQPNNMYHCTTCHT